MSKVLGLKFVGHDTGAALIAGKEIVAISEERLNRVKHSFGMFPHLAIAYCLRALGCASFDIDLVVIDQVGLRNEGLTKQSFARATDGRFRNAQIHIINHHDAHAASAFFSSPFEEAAVLVYDGSGERFLTHHGVYAVETETLYRGMGTQLIPIQKTMHAAPRGPVTRFPYTTGAGKLYSYLSKSYLGFGPYNEGKLMGLAAYGDLSLLDQFPLERWCKEVNGHVLCNAQFCVPPPVNNSLHERLRVFATKVPSLLQRALAYPHRRAARSLYLGLYDAPNVFTPIPLPKPPRPADQPLPERYYASVARAAQFIVEHVGIVLGGKLRSLVASDNLCVAGGLGLNLDANRNFLERVGYRRLFVQPASSDAGIPLGCALWGNHIILENERFYAMQHAFLGQQYSELDIETALKKFSSQVTYVRESAITRRAAALIAEGSIVAWYEGACEYGPRALGHRSLLADPRRRDSKDILNHRIKHREDWRPFAAAVLKEHLRDFFKLDHESPFMLLAAEANPEARSTIPAVLHVDGTSRIQTVSSTDPGRFRALIEDFFVLTGVPMILNTSFNIAGQPIVETPDDALETFLGTDVDYLVIEDYLIQKRN
jgi:carbamoyltransferase